ncbi:MAG: histidinol dehydrogenase [Firmicutes bacterium]|nr:histidinol dehydrogenase [Bacillota bacterium]
MPDVGPILEAVRTRGADAVLEFTARFDGITLTPEELIYDPARVALPAPDADAQAAVDFAVERVRQFHEQCRPTATKVQEPGLSLEERWVPLQRVGIYVPNGLYPLLSSLIMSVVPAQAAGVGEIVVALSPRHDSRRHPLWNYALRKLGVREVLAAGGAQAIAAMAYGLPGLLKPVSLIAGPGNAWVAAAKQALFAAGVVGIDLVAGPSEVLVIADEEAPVDWVALDLLSQAEHSPDAEAIFITWSPTLLSQVKAAVEQERAQAPHPQTLGPITFRLVADPAEAVEQANRIAPEHLALVGAKAEDLAGQVTTAGAVFIGPLAGQALGDYVAGPSHVLPTQGTGRFLSGLSTRTFMRKISVISPGENLRTEYLRHGATLADLEGLYFHAEALRRRMAAMERRRR